MILQAPREQVDAILGAMAAVALADGPEGVTTADRVTVAAAGRVLFGLPEDVAIEGLRARSPEELAAALPDEGAAATAGRVLAVMALADGVLDAAKVDLVEGVRRGARAARGLRAGADEPRRFWTAWDRGAATAADLLDPSWDFWGATGVPLDELRRAYSVLPLDPALAA